MAAHPPLIDGTKEAKSLAKFKKYLENRNGDFGGRVAVDTRTITPQDEDRAKANTSIFVSFAITTVPLPSLLRSNRMLTSEFLHLFGCCGFLPVYVSARSRPEADAGS
jgi:hypothetical protein